MISRDNANVQYRPDLQAVYTDGAAASDSSTHSQAADGSADLLLAAGLALYVYLLLRVPAGAREALFVGGAWLILVAAIRNFVTTWIILAGLIPVLALLAPLFGNDKITGLRIILVGVVLVFAILNKSEGFYKQLCRPLAFAAFALFILGNVVAGIASGEIESVFRALTYLEPLLFYMLSYFIVRRDSKYLPRLLKMVVLAGFLVGVVGLLEFAFQQPMARIFAINDMTLQVASVPDSFYLDRIGLGSRVQSLLRQPVYAGIYFGLWVIALIYYYLTYQPQKKKLLLLLVPIGGFLVLLTGTRAALLAFVPAVLALVFVEAKQRSLKNAVQVTVLVTVIALLSFAALPQLRQYLRASFMLDQNNSASANVLGRLDLTQRMFTIFREQPLFGMGPGLIQKGGYNGNTEFEDLRGLENQYATILADGGLAAGFPYLLYIAGTLLLSWKMLWSRNAEVAAGGLAMLILFVYYFTFVATATCVALVPNYILSVIFGATVARYDNEIAPIRSGME